MKTKILRSVSLLLLANLFARSSFAVTSQAEFGTLEKKSSRSRPDKSRTKKDVTKSNFALRNSVGEALYSVFYKTGSATSPAGDDGFGIEFKDSKNWLGGFTFGSTTSEIRNLQTSQNKKAKISSFSLDSALLLGDRGSFFQLGLSLSAQQGSLTDKTDAAANVYLNQHYLSAYPSIGARLVSNSELILVMKLSETVPLGRNILDDFGATSNKASMFNTPRGILELALGMGI